MLQSSEVDERACDVRLTKAVRLVVSGYRSNRIRLVAHSSNPSPRYCEIIPTILSSRTRLTE